MMMGVALLEANDPEPLFERHSNETVAREVARLILYGLVAEEDRQKKPRAARVAKGVEP
jgi:hypothetical protein